MPKVALIQTNFSGGELSPFLLGRVDVAKYNNGAARMQDFHTVVQGGAVSRPGSHYLGQAKGACRLLPFVYERGTAYQIEFGYTNLGGYLRVWRVDGSQVKSGAVPLELATPYDVSAYLGVTYEQAEDTMFLFHPAFTPHRLQRLDDLTWRLEPVPFVTPPFNEQGFRSTIDVTLSAATVGTGRTATAVAPAFIASDIGRDFESGLGTATVTGFTSSTVVTLTITSAFASTSLTDFSLTDSARGFIYARQKEPAGSTVVVDGAIGRAAGLTLSDTSGAITVTADASVFVPGDTGKVLYADAGSMVLTYASGTSCTGTAATSYLRKSYQTGSWGITGDVFRTDDVGSYIRLNSGLLKITAFSTAAQVQAEIKVPMSAIVAAPPGAWSMEQASFNATAGYPRCGALHEQRLYLASTVSQAQQAWASRIGEYLDFEPGLLDADGFTYALNTRQRNPILHLASGKRLFALTSGLEVSIRGGNEKAIGPTNIQKDNESSFGTTNVRPVVVAKEVLYVQGAGRKIRALGFSAAVDGFDSPDRTVFAEHVTESGIVDMAYQPERHSLLYCVRNDGQMAVAAYDVAQEVIAWSRYVTDGYYRSVSVIPNFTTDDVWTVVDRPVEGTSRYMIERLGFVSDLELATDCASVLNVADFGVPSVNMAGLDRFNGRQVAVKADDSYMGLFTVTGGSITIPRNATRYIEAGLPFTPEIEMLPPELGGGGTAQASNLSVHEVAVRLLDTNALEINGEQSDFREFGSSLLDQPPPGFTGDYRVIKLADDLIRDTLVIRQPFPFKTHVQAVIRKLTVNDV